MDGDVIRIVFVVPMAFLLMEGGSTPAQTIRARLVPTPGLFSTVEQEEESSLRATKRGREILMKAIEAIGGFDALRNVRNYTRLSRTRQATLQGILPMTAKLFVEFPNKMRREVVTPLGEMGIIYSGQQAWRRTPQGVEELGGEELEAVKKVMARNLLRTLFEAHRGGRRVQFLGSEALEKDAVDVLAVTKNGGNRMRLYVDKNSGHVLRQVFESRSPFAGKVDETRLFSDFRPVDNLVLPFNIVVLHDGKKLSETKVDSYEVNIELEPGVFHSTATKVDAK